MSRSTTAIECDGRYELSFAQERLWFLNQFSPESPAYNVPAVIPWPGPLNIAALERSLSEIVRRHESLRTTFVSVDGRPMQQVRPAEPIQLRRIDLREMPDAAREAEAQRLAAEEALRPFDLEKGPLFRAALVQLADDNHWLLLGMHHIVADGWSLGLLLKEISELYEAFASGRPSPLPELPLQYADYAIWQRNWLQGDPLEQLLDYWREQMQGATGILELPADRPRPPVQSFRGGAQVFRVSEKTAAALKALAQEQEATLFMVLLAAYKTLLSRFTGEHDLIVGTPIANRNRVEIEELIGFFVNTLALRTDLSGDPSFRELVSREREVTLGAYAHQDLPFERLIEDLQPTRRLSHHPLFQVMFALQNIPTLDDATGMMPSEDHGSGNSDTPVSVGVGTSKFDLSLFMDEISGGLSGTLEYSLDLFDHPTATGYIDCFLTLLDSIAQDPDRPISSLSILPPNQKEQSLESWRAPVPSPIGELAHEPFLQQASQRPDATAIRFGDERVSYGRLRSMSETIAATLIESTDSAGRTVAILSRQGPWRIASLLGTLEAGAAFVCLDPFQPEKRLEQILYEAAPAVILCDADSKQQHLALLTSSGIPVLVAEELARASLDSTTKYTTEINSQDLCYVAFTSGSTGIPKRIVQSHDSFRGFIDWFSKEFKLDPSHRVAQWSAISFDPAYAEIFASLSRGAELCLPNVETRTDASETLAWLRQENITLLQAVPSFSKILLQRIDLDSNPNPLPDLRCLLFAGEALPSYLIRAWQRLGLRAEIFNLYGPAETIVVSCHRIGSESLSGEMVPIGLPIADCRVALLDPNGGLCPRGALGEIVVKSSYMAGGDIRDESSRGFVPDPLDPSCETVYRTGDLGRWNGQGLLEFHGRLDGQVKIRGQRVELEEVEAVLGSHPDVSECAIVNVKSDEGDPDLFGYYTGTLDSSAARSFLAEQLPDYMTPTAIVALDSMPLTPSGKIDRLALSKRVVPRSKSTAPFRAPQTMQEKKLAAIFGKLLKVDSIGLDDNFFELGGHSLLANQTVNEIRRRFGREVPLPRFFENPTVVALASVLGTNEPEGIADVERLEQLLAEIEELSDEQTKTLVAEYQA